MIFGLGASAALAGRDPIPGRTTPAPNDTGKPIKIGLISFPESDEFFSAVKVGADAARDVLSNCNATVDYLTVNEFTQDAVNAAGRAALLQGYNAIAFLPLDAGACPLIKEAVTQGIKVAVFITTADCAQAWGFVLPWRRPRARVARHCDRRARQGRERRSGVGREAMQGGRHHGRLRGSDA